MSSCTMVMRLNTALAMFAAILGSLTLLPKLILLVQPLGKVPAAKPGVLQAA